MINLKLFKDLSFITNSNGKVTTHIDSFTDNELVAQKSLLKLTSILILLRKFNFR